MAGILLSLAAGACGPQQPPNIVLIVADTLRADSVSINGHPVELTPTLDALAREGVNFTAAYAHSTWTKPSMASLFTATYPDTHGIQTVQEGDVSRPTARKLRADLTTLAERLQEGGFTTAAVGNQVQLEYKYGFGQGFDYYSWSTGRTSYHVTDRLRRWLENGFDEPLFIYLHYLDPHWPYWHRVERVEQALGDLDTDPPLPNRGNEVQAWLDAGVSEESLANLRAQYDHGAAFMDDSIGFALEMLAEHGVLDDAIIVVTSDHGEGFGEHGKVLHGYEPYEEVLKVPLIIRAPKRLGFGPRVVAARVGLVDVMPTLLEAVGLEPVFDQGDGRSLVPLMQGRAGSRRPVYAETHGVRSLTQGRWKLIRRPDGQVEYYDLQTDPMEQSPLACNEDCLGMSEDLEAVVAAAQAKASGAESVELDEADLERLRALGYLDN